MCEPPGGRARENRKFIQAPSPEIWSETISSGEEVLAQKWGGLFWATSLEKIFGGELRRLHHRQIGGLFTFEDAIDVDEFSFFARPPPRGLAHARPDDLEAFPSGLGHAAGIATRP